MRDPRVCPHRHSHSAGGRIIRPDGSALPAGIYGASAEPPALTCLRQVPFGQLAMCADMADVSSPAVVVLLCLNPLKRRQYVNTYELGLLEAGELLQNIALVATSTGLGSCVLGSVFDEPFWSLIDGHSDLTATVRAYGAPVTAVALGVPATPSP